MKAKTNFYISVRDKKGKVLGQKYYDVGDTIEKEHENQCPKNLVTNKEVSKPKVRKVSTKRETKNAAPKKTEDKSKK